MREAKRSEKKQKIRKVLEMAVNAPSGDNCQPWKFILKDSGLTVVLLRGLDNTLYNYREFGSIFSHGALVENIIVASTGFNLKPRISFFPNGEEEDIITSIVFDDAELQPQDQLFDSIALRHTNRKPYKTRSLREDEKKALFDATRNFANGKFHVLERSAFQEPFLQALSLNDELMFSNKQLHETLFSIVNWTEEEDIQRVRGLFVKTMELSYDQILAFRQLKNWTLMKKLRSLGVPKLIAATNRKLYQASSAIGLISVDQPLNSDFLLGGRMAERIWLTATKLGLSMHPVSGIPFLALRIRLGERSFFTQDEIERIISADNIIRKFFNLGERIIALMFRVGEGEPATARSKKLSPAIEER